MVSKGASSARAISTARFLMGDGNGQYREVWDAVQKKVVVIARSEVDGKDPCCGLYSCPMPNRHHSEEITQKAGAAGTEDWDEPETSEDEDSLPATSADSALKLLRRLQTSPELPALSSSRRASMLLKGRESLADGSADSTRAHGSAGTAGREQAARTSHSRRNSMNLKGRESLADGGASDAAAGATGKEQPVRTPHSRRNSMNVKVRDNLGDFASSDPGASHTYSGAGSPKISFADQRSSPFAGFNSISDSGYKSESSSPKPARLASLAGVDQHKAVSFAEDSFTSAESRSSSTASQDPVERARSTSQLLSRASSRPLDSGVPGGRKAVSFASDAEVRIEEPSSSGYNNKLPIGRSKSTGKLEATKLPHLGVFDSSIPGSRSVRLSRATPAEPRADLAGGRTADLEASSARTSSHDGDGLLDLPAAEWEFAISRIKHGSSDGSVAGSTSSHGSSAGSSTRGDKQRSAVQLPPLANKEAAADAKPAQFSRPGRFSAAASAVMALSSLGRSKSGSSAVPSTGSKAGRNVGEGEFRSHHVKLDALDHKALTRAKSEKDSTRYDKIISGLL